MGATDIYQLPWPELGDLADGPDGYQDLARATEAALLTEKTSNADTQSYTPSFTSNGIQPSGMSWTARYQVRNGWCDLSIFGQMSANTSGGTGMLAVGLPVRSRAGIPEQNLVCKLYNANVGWNFVGFAFMGNNGQVCYPFFPTRDSSSVMFWWNNGNGQAGNTSQCPIIPGHFACGGGPGNIGIWGRYMV